MRSGERTISRARELRRDLSLPEVLLWEQLRGGRLQGLRFRRQHPVGPYVLDFFCPASRLAIEIDGAQHDVPEAITRDERRDAWLASQGINILRIPASDILDDHPLDGALRLIASVARGGGEIPPAYRSTTPPPPPSAVPLPRKRGRIRAEFYDQGSVLPENISSHPVEGADAATGSSPAKRGKGTAEGGGGGVASPSPGRVMSGNALPARAETNEGASAAEATPPSTFPDLHKSSPAEALT
jgi:very-short-patch-repair endonuclease